LQVMALLELGLVSAQQGQRMTVGSRSEV
jgi:hypothetical protein